MSVRLGRVQWLQGVRSTGFAPFAVSTAGDGTKSGMDSGRYSYEEMGTFTGSNSTSAIVSSAASFTIFVASPLAVDWLYSDGIVRDVTGFQIGFMDLLRMLTVL